MQSQNTSLITQERGQGYIWNGEDLRKNKFEDKFKASKFHVEKTIGDIWNNK